MPHEFTRFTALSSACEALGKLNAALRWFNDSNATECPEIRALEKLAETTEDTILEMCDADLMRDHAARLLGTRSRRVISHMPDSKPGQVALVSSNDQLGKIFIDASIDEIDLMFDKGLSFRGRYDVVMHTLNARAKSDPETARALADLVATRLAPIEKPRDSTHHLGLFSPEYYLCDPLILPPILRAHVAAFPDDSRMAAETVLANDLEHPALCLHLAGVDLGELLEDHTTWNNGLETAIGNLLQSAHGRLRLDALTGTLEDYLENPDTAQTQIREAAPGKRTN